MLTAVARDLIHLGQALALEGMHDLHSRLESGRYLDDFEIEALSDWMGLETAYLRELNAPQVTAARRSQLLQNAPATTNALKTRRISTTSQYVDLVSRIGEARATPSARRERAKRRKEVLCYFKELRPRGRSSRVRSAVRSADLARVVAFVSTGDPGEIWANGRIRDRNWAVVSLLVFAGLRSGEVRQLRADDIDTNRCIVSVYRRPDDARDPRVNEPNAKTADRIIPISAEVADRLDAYLQSDGQEASKKFGSPFAFLSAGNSSFGRPISHSVVDKIVRQLGAHLDVSRLHPHALRSAWVQQLADWANAEGISPAELDRFANYLGGWSYFSKSASNYRGDHLTKKAFEAGLVTEKNR